MDKTVLISIPVEKLQGIIIDCVNTCLRYYTPPSAPLPQAQSEEQLSIRQLAKYLNCSLPTIHLLKKEGIIPYYRLGRKIYFKKTEIDACAYVGNRFLNKKLHK